MMDFLQDSVVANVIDAFADIKSVLYALGIVAIFFIAVVLLSGCAGRTYMQQQADICRTEHGRPVTVYDSYNRSMGVHCWRGG